MLLSTGHAILIDTVEGDPSWVSEADEFELQHLLTKQYITPSSIIDWMTERVKSPSALSHIRVLFDYIEFDLNVAFFLGPPNGDNGEEGRR